MGRRQTENNKDTAPYAALASLKETAGRQGVKLRDHRKHRPTATDTRKALPERRPRRDTSDAYVVLLFSTAVTRRCTGGVSPLSRRPLLLVP